MRALAALAALLAASAASADAYPTSGSGHEDTSGFNERVARGTLEGGAVGLLLGHALTDASDVRASGGPLRLVGGALAGASIGFGAPIFFGWGKRTRVADVVFENFLEDAGLLHGLLLPAVFHPGDCCARIDTGLGAVLSLTGLALSFYWRDRLDLSPGQASALLSALTWGALAGLALSSVVFGDLRGEVGRRFANGLTLLGADTAVWWAFSRRGELDVDRSRVLWIDAGVLLGAVLGFGIAALVSPASLLALSPSFIRVGAAATLVGAGAGGAAGYFLGPGDDLWRRSAPASAPVGRAVLSYREGRLSPGAPTPRLLVAPGSELTPGRLGAALDLLEGRF
jgi:hypothetical protein